MLELLDGPIRFVRLPVVSVEWLVDTAVRACACIRSVGQWVHTSSAPAPIGVGRGHGTEGIGFDAG